MFVSCFICYYFLPFRRLSFHFAYNFLYCASNFKHTYTHAHTCTQMCTQLNILFSNPFFFTLYNILSIFSCVCQPSVCLRRNICLVLWPIFFIWLFIFLVLSCMSCLFIFKINSLSVASFAVIFSHLESCLFTLLIVSFVVQKLLILIRSICLFLLLFPVFWEVGHRGSCCDLCRRVFWLCSPLGVL